MVQPLESHFQIPMLTEYRPKSKQVSWVVVGVVLSIFFSLAAIAFSSYNVGHAIGYSEGYAVGYISRGKELPLVPRCYHIPNCEPGD